MTLSFICLLALISAEPAKEPDAKAALQPFNALVGSWKCVGKYDDKSKEFWTEKAAWEWKFAKDSLAMKVQFTDGKQFASGELKFVADKKQYELVMTTLDKVKQTYIGKLTIGQQKETILELDREAGNEIHRMTLTILHSNRYLLSLSMKPSSGGTFTRKYQIGSTKEGEPFANVGKGNECIVSGGKGSISVMYKGSTYYVCCSGCKDEFLANPEKYVKK